MFQVDSFSGYNCIAFTHKIVFKAFRMNSCHFIFVQVKNTPVFGVHVTEVQADGVNICSRIINTIFHSTLGKRLSIYLDHSGLDIQPMHKADFKYHVARIYIHCMLGRWGEGTRKKMQKLVSLGQCPCQMNMLSGVNMQLVKQYLIFWEPAYFKCKNQKSGGVASALQATKYRNLIGTGNACVLVLNHATKNVYGCFYWLEASTEYFLLFEYVYLKCQEK